MYVKGYLKIRGLFTILHWKLDLPIRLVWIHPIFSFNQRFFELMINKLLFVIIRGFFLPEEPGYACSFNQV